MSFAPLILALGLLGSAAPARAEDHGAGCPMMGPELGLTDAQKAQMADIHFRASTARIGIKARIATAKLEIEHDFTSATLDEKAINKAVDALNAATSDLRKNTVEEMIACRKVLTAEQAARAAAMPGGGCGMERGHGRRDDEGEDDGDRGWGGERGERGGRGSHEGPPPPPRE